MSNIQDHDEGEIAYLDGTTANADWAKRTWSFIGPPVVQADFIAGVRGTTRAEAQAKADAFLRLPAAQAMPLAVKEELELRGLRLDGGTQDAS